MFGLQMLDVAIGIIFVFVLVSLICSAVREGIESYLKTRAAYLEFGIRELLHDKGSGGLANSFFNHPLIYSLYSEPYPDKAVNERPHMFARGKGLPSYIPSRNFAMAMMDIAARGPETNEFTAGPGTLPLTLAGVRANIMNIDNPPVQRAMLMAIDSAGGDLDVAQANLAAWYESSMDRVSGWYKRSTHKVLLYTGLLVAVGLNINTLAIGEYLYHDDIARAAIVARAEAAVQDSAFLSRSYEQTRETLGELNLPIGWDDFVRPTGAWDWVSMPLGWIVTALAATLGAPFWFDVLNRVMVIRSTVKPHEKSKEEASEDRQKPHGRDGGGRDAAAPEATAGATGAPADGAGAPPGGAERPVVPRGLAPAPRDEDAVVDGCDVEVHALMDEELTADEELPAAEGGVA